MREERARWQPGSCATPAIISSGDDMSCLPTPVWSRAGVLVCNVTALNNTHTTLQFLNDEGVTGRRGDRDMARGRGGGEHG